MNGAWPRPGNVALDCARMLSSTPEQLVGETDVAQHAAAEVARSSVRQVVMLGRRGVLHAAFTIKELRELSKRSGTYADAPRHMHVGRCTYSQ